MKMYRLRFVAAILVSLCWFLDMQENRSVQTILPKLEKNYVANGNPVSYSLDQDICASVSPNGALIIGIDADIQSTTSDQGYFRIGSETSNIQLETIPERFHVLQIVSTQPTDSQIIRLGQQAWSGNRKFMVVLRGRGLMTAHGDGLTEKTHTMLIPKSCRTISVGGFLDRGDFQGQVSVSIKVVEAQDELDQVIQSMYQSPKSNSPSVVGRAVLYLLLLGFFFGAVRTVKDKCWRPDCELPSHR